MSGSGPGGDHRRRRSAGTGRRSSDCQGRQPPARPCGRCLEPAREGGWSRPMLSAERRGVGGVQVDLVVGAADPEPDRLIRRTTPRSSSRTTVSFAAIVASMPVMGYLTVPITSQGRDQAPRGGRRPCVDSGSQTGRASADTRSTSGSCQLLPAKTLPALARLPTETAAPYRRVPRPDDGPRHWLEYQE